MHPHIKHPQQTARQFQMLEGKLWHSVTILYELDSMPVEIGKKNNFHHFKLKLES
jgi:hypothetical protein